MALRFGEVTIKRPGNCSDPAAAHQLTLRLVEVRELDTAVEGPIHGRLLTTHEVTTVAQALEIVAWYRERWHIEQLFRTCKSQGLDLESSQVEAADALFKLAAIAMIAATKIMQLVLARDGTVDRPATDVVAVEQLPMLEALQIRLEGKTAKQALDPRRSIGWLAWVVPRASVAGPVTPPNAHPAQSPCAVAGIASNKWLRVGTTYRCVHALALWER